MSILAYPASGDAKLWCTQNQAEIFRLKIKFGDLPRWVRSCLKQKPMQSWKFPLRYCETSDLVSQANEVLNGLRTRGIESGHEQQKGDFKTPIAIANILHFPSGFDSFIVVGTKSTKKRAAIRNATHEDVRDFRIESNGIGQQVHIFAAQCRLIRS